MNSPSRSSKACIRGTHRAQSPGETVRRLRPLLGELGITRVANVTGLDHIGIAVAQACRPGSRSLAVSQGKGLDLDAARASAIMESAECHHAERMRLPLELASSAEMRRRRPVVDVDRLPRAPDSVFHSQLPLLWVQGQDWMRDEPVWLPYQLVHTVFAASGPLRLEAPSFAMSTNGLASGNHRLEAASHALCEVIEREASHRFAQLPAAQRRACRVDLDSVDDADCRALLQRYDQAGVAVAVWDMRGDLGLPAYQCAIADRADGPLGPMPAAAGAGCHVSRAVALARALTEAAQSRLTAIAGARDDIERQRYVWDAPAVDHLRRVRADLDTPGDRPFRHAPSFESPCFEEDVALALRVLREAGFDRAVLVDLSLPEFDLAVVRAVVPGARWQDHRIPSPATAGACA